MVVATCRSTPVRISEKVGQNNNIDDELPMVDLSAERSVVRTQIVKASEEFGFFKVINHGVSQDVITGMEEESWGFFEKPFHVKQQAGPADPYGYGCKNIGIHGDKGEVEYLLLHTNPLSVSERSKTINSTEPFKFRCAVTGYVEAVKELASEILEMMAEGLWVPDRSALSSLIRDVDADSLLRLNYYPPLLTTPNNPNPNPNNNNNHNRDMSPSSRHHHTITTTSRIGFGEHTDPQILTLLRSNDVGGLQISLRPHGVWVPVTPHPTAFFVIVGDLLQAMTNGRFKSARHRAVVNSYRARMSMAYFAAPSVHQRISPLLELVTTTTEKLYRSFTWGEYKKATYSKRLGDTRLNLFVSPNKS